MTETTKTPETTTETIETTETPEAPKKPGASGTQAPETQASETRSSTEKAAGGESRTGSSWRVRAVGAVVAMALAAAVTAGVLQWRQASALQDEKATRRAVATAASAFGKALLSYDHANLQAARDRVLALAGDDFAKTYDEAFTGGLEGLISKLKATAVASVRDVYVGEIDGSRAKAIAVFDSQVTSDTGTRRMLGTYLEMKLVQSRGRWLVDDVNAVGAASETVTKPDGTVVPASPSPAPSKKGK